MRRHTERLRYITRFEYGGDAERQGTRAWWVRFQRTVEGRKKTWSKFFSDSVHGGKEAALEAAIQWRDAQLTRIPPPIRYNGRRREPGRGYVKQMQRSYVNTRGERIYYDAMIAWLQLEDGRAASTNFSIEKWGKRLAEQKCHAWLQATREAMRWKKVKRSRSRAARSQASAPRRRSRRPSP